MPPAPPLHVRLMPIIPAARQRGGVCIEKFHNLYVVLDTSSRFMAVAVDSPDCDNSDLVVSLAGSRRRRR